MIRIANGVVWDGTGSAPRLADVLVEGDRIRAIKLPGVRSEHHGQEEIIDASGCTVMPGLFDLHTHITMLPSGDRALANRRGALGAAVVGAAHAARFLRAGITSIRDVGAWQAADLALRDAIVAGVLPGPRIFGSGQALTMTGGHGWQTGYEVDGPYEARKGARLQIRAGADNIKLMTSGNVIGYRVKPGCVQMQYDEVRAAVEAAENAGKPTAAHSSGAEPIKVCVRAGIGSIEHGILLDEEGIELMLEKGTLYVPTLLAPYLIAEAGSKNPSPAYDSAKAASILAIHKQGVARAYRAGVPIGVGTDAGCPFNYPGGVANEIEQLVQAGLTVGDALAGATRIAAKAVRMDDLLGTLEPGKLADVAVFGGDPWSDLSSLSRVTAAFKGGKAVELGSEPA